LTRTIASVYNAGTRTLVAGMLLLSLVGASRADEAAAPAPSGRLEVTERVHDAGKVDRGTTLRHVFLLKNTGAAALSIDAKPG